MRVSALLTGRVAVRRLLARREGGAQVATLATSPARRRAIARLAGRG